MLTDERIKAIIEQISCTHLHKDVAEALRELLERRKEALEPAEQCENCDEYYVASAMRMTEDNVNLCPGCSIHCALDQRVSASPFL